MRAHQATLPVRTLCKLLGVSPSGFYAWLSRPPSPRASSDAELSEAICLIHAESDGTYGSRRVHAELLDPDQPYERYRTVGRRRVARLMRQARLQGVSRRRRTKTTIRGERSGVAADLVERHFQADGPDQLWVADITYVPTWAGFVFLAVVVDVCSRKVVGWSMADHLKTKLVVDAMDMAVSQRRPSGVIHHSDQGCQYTSTAFGKRCRQLGVRPSTGTVGDCYDNAMCESFFATLECELIDRRTFRTKSQARLEVFRFIEGWYNPRRRHSALGYKSPNRFEQDLLAA